MARFSSSFGDSWSRHDDFTFAAAEAEEKPCAYAQRYAAQVEPLCQAARQKPTQVVINQTLWWVCRLYWEWFYLVPKSHRNRVDERGHRCIHAVFRQSYECLKLLELSLNPSTLFPPPPSPPPPPAPRPVVHTIAGITLGEILDEES